MDDIALHSHLIGKQGSRRSLNTPVLVLDKNALDRNIAAMAALAAQHGVGLRPHAKTHKSVDIARRQIAAGAVGQCCAKIGEAEVLVDGGIGGVLITSPVAASAAIDRLAKLATRATALMATVDDPETARRIDHALDLADARLDLLIDVDPGIHRTGVASAIAAVELADMIAVLPRLTLRGVQFYCGVQQHIGPYADRRAAIEERTAYLTAVITALREAGHAIEIISGGGTGTHAIDLDIGVFTELQAGSYVFMDRQYHDCELGTAFETALMVDTRVVSANHAALVTIDAGFKALSTDGGSAAVIDGAPADTRVVFMGDEHAALIGPGIGERMRPGDPVTLMVPHCDPTVNLYDTYHLVEGDTLVALWSVGARGRSR